ncbi:MAG TPA: DUF4835 family protein [Balneolaceae bacterium]|nr:DUF4835 family protein [Balneolaceae bacterium]
MITSLFWLMSSPVFGQEISADVSVDRSRINSTSLNYLDNFAVEIENYINEYDWINAGFLPEERIDVDMQIILLGMDDDYNFAAQLIIRSRRPIYNSLQETALFLFNDENWSFNYTPNRALIHDELQFDALTSVLDYYAYIVLGYDFDSFDRLGGTPYFLEAQNIVSRAQTTSAAGWSRSGGSDRNRAQLVADLLNPAYSGLREAIYQYHRQGLDAFIDNPQKAREEILEALRKIQDTQRTTSNNLLFNIFFNTKYREITAIFEDADPQIRVEAFNLLAEIDPGHLSAYRELQ